MTKREVERTALTQLELDNMYEKQFQAERLNIVKDIFLFVFLQITISHLFLKLAAPLVTYVEIRRHPKITVKEI